MTQEILLLGINHKTAPVELRECIAFSSDEVDVALERLIQSSDINEVMLISTCNRVEMLFTTETPDTAVDRIKTFLAEFNRVQIDKFESSFYLHHGDDAVRHLFRVASSLDSMIVGESQILGQIKDAYRAASRKKTSGVILNRLLHRTFFVAKRVRTETGIADHAVSVSYAAIDLGRKIFGTLEGKRVLLIGAGEMAELAVEHLIQNHADDISVANRTFERADNLSKKFKGKAIHFQEIIHVLDSVDIIISSTASEGFVVMAEDVRRVIRKRRNRPLFFIDIAVPRDIDPKANQISNVYVYDIDDLTGVIEENIEDRAREALKGERIVDEGVIRFREWLESLDVIPTIVGIREKISLIARRELEKTLQSNPDFSETDMQTLTRMVEAIVNKILHDPTTFLKKTGEHGDRSQYLDVAQKLFKLN